MDADKTVEPWFVQSDRYTVTTSVAPAEGGEVRLRPPPPAEGYTEGAEVNLFAFAEAGFKFARWEGGLTGSTNPVSIVMDSSRTVTAVFELYHVLTVGVGPAGGGTVALEPSQSPDGYVEGTQVTVTAVAADGYRFDHWSGDLSGSDNPVTVTMTAAKEVVANFAKRFPWQGIVGGVVGGVFVLIVPSYLIIRKVRSGARPAPGRR